MTIQRDRLMLLGLCLGLWLVAHPFSGIWHDGKFYALQALQHLNPQAFSRDLFFLFGSQDQYSVFSRIHAHAISIFGLNDGTMVLQAFGLILWLLAAWALCRATLGDKAPIALLLIASTVGSYGSEGLLSFGESFLTARLYAEFLSLGGLAAWLCGRRLLGGSAFAFATAMHPLIALPVIVIGLGVLLQPKIWFGLLGLGALLALGLGGLGVPPFTGLWQPMDALWWDLAVARSPFVFLHSWEWEGYSRALFVVVVTATAWRLLPTGQLRNLAWVTLVCTAGAFLIAYLGGSLLQLPLIAGLQLTRIIWVGLVITLILIPATLLAVRKENVWERVLVWGLALAVFLDIRAQGGYVLLLLAVCWLAARKMPRYKPPVWLWLLLALVPLQIMLWQLISIRSEAQWEALFTERPVWRAYVSNHFTALIAAAGAYWLLEQNRISKLLSWPAGVCVVSLLAFAIITWYDVRPELDYESRARQAAIAPIAALVADTATVYWVEEPEKAWFWLRRANYLSFSQTAGSVFSRGTAIEALRRAAFVRTASLRDANQIWGQQNVPAGFISESAIREACRDPTLDYVIARSQPKAGLAYFTDPVTGWGYGLHDCRTVRASVSTVAERSAVDIRNRFEGYL